MDWFLVIVAFIITVGGSFAVLAGVLFCVYYFMERSRKKDFWKNFGFQPDKKESEVVRKIHLGYLKEFMGKEKARLDELDQESQLIYSLIKEGRISVRSHPDYQDFAHEN